MRAYLLRRVTAGIPIVIGVTMLTFLLFYVFGGNPVAQFLGKHASARDLAAFEHEYGFDRPIYLQYLDYLWQIVRLDFGRSFVTREPAGRMLFEHLGPTLSLTVPALIATTMLSLSAALIAAFFRGRPVDRILVVLMVIGMSMSFLVYIVVGQYLLAYKWPLFHIHGYQSGAIERWPYLALPTIIIVLVGMGYDTRYYRSVIVEESHRDYVTTALAKGLSWPRVLLVHVLRNASIPVITRVMISIPLLVTGSLLLESFFGIPGIGGMLLEAIDQADFPVIKAYTVMISLLWVLINIVTDVLYAWADPRVRLS